MAYEFLSYEKKDRVVTITIQRPERMNALHGASHAEFDDAWNTFAADDSAWVVIVTGAGDKAFCAGNDLRATAEGGVPSLPKTGFAGITSRHDLWKPVIAAVNGFALGGGFEIALSCDLIIAAEHAKFGVPEPRVGLMAAAGGVHRLPRHIPLKTAMGYMLTGRHMSAAEAYRLGIVNEVVPAAELMAAANRWADEIAQNSPLSVRSTKRAAMESLDLSVADAMQASRAVEKALFSSEDAVEGPLAFSQKRKPVWKGK